MVKNITTIIRRTRRGMITDDPVTRLLLRPSMFYVSSLVRSAISVSEPVTSTTWLDVASR